ncbi:MAG: TIGR03668 family PPOX class F420-dependent oxidoreductase [Acidimicrobiales bacterium]
MNPSIARQRVRDAAVGRLGTITAGRRPHLVPCCFVLRGETVYTAVDGKPKSTLALRRIDNLMADPNASLLVDHYEDDWLTLWWVRLDGTGRIVESANESDAAKRALVEKYPQYRELGIPGQVIALDIDTWRAWP